VFRLAVFPRGLVSWRLRFFSCQKTNPPPSRVRLGMSFSPATPPHRDFPSFVYPFFQYFSLHLSASDGPTLRSSLIEPLEVIAFHNGSPRQRRPERIDVSGFVYAFLRALHLALHGRCRPEHFSNLENGQFFSPLPLGRFH